MRARAREDVQGHDASIMTIPPQLERERVHEAIVCTTGIINVIWPSVAYLYINYIYTQRQVLKHSLQVLLRVADAADDARKSIYARIESDERKRGRGNISCARMQPRHIHVYLVRALISVRAICASAWVVRGVLDARALQPSPEQCLIEQHCLRAPEGSCAAKGEKLYSVYI